MKTTLLKRAYRRGLATLQLSHLAVRDRRSFGVIRHVRTAGLSFLGLAALLDLYRAVRRVEAAHIPGRLLETGTALGGSALVIAAAKAPARPLYLYDVFGLIPPPSINDGAVAQERYAAITTGSAQGIGGGRYYGYQENLLDQVQATFRKAGVDPAAEQICFVQGLYEETLYPDGPVAFAHLDCDWYESVKTCLERIVPRLARGGILVLDDYFQWPGCKRAVDEYFASRQAEFVFEQHARLHIVRR
jgi:predicted O-methyltransferase YrrM